MHQQIDFKEFVSQLSIKSSLSSEALEAMVFELFVHIRTNTECGLWVDVEGFGSFHPLWYAIKKHKDSQEDVRILKEIAVEAEKHSQELLKETQKLKQEQAIKAEEDSQEDSKWDEESLAHEKQRVQKLLDEAIARKEAYQRAKEEKRIEAETILAQEAFALEKEEDLFEEIKKMEKETQEAERLKDKLLKEEANRLASEHEAQEARIAKFLREKHEVEAEKRKREIEKIDELLMQKAKEAKVLTVFKKTTMSIKFENIKRKKVIYGLMAFIIIVLALLFSVPKEEVKTQERPKTVKKKTKVLYKSFEKEEKKVAQTSEKFYEYRVLEGNNLYDLSQTLYGESKYWPLIYVENMDKVRDMDKIYPGKTLHIPRIPKGSSAQEALIKVYIKVYKAYKRLEKDNKAHWFLYWGQQNIDEKLLERFSQEISPEDRKQVQSYLERFKG